MQQLSGNIGGDKFPQMVRGEIYTFTYTNYDSEMKNSMITNPVMIFSSMNQNRRLEGLNIRSVRNPTVLLQDFEKFYGKINNMQPEDKTAFQFRILKAIFLRNPDILKAWRNFNPLWMKDIKHINIEEAQELIMKPIQVRISDMGVK